MFLKTLTTVAAVTGLTMIAAQPSQAATPAEIAGKSKIALERCYATVKGCKELGAKANGILVFPDVTKGGVGVGGSYGEGALMVNGKFGSYYSTSSVSIGIQVGIQDRSEVIMFLTPAALTAFEKSSGWEVGADANVAMMDEGASDRVDTIAATEPVVAFVFGEKGLMADLSLKGSKISPLVPSK